MILLITILAVHIFYTIFNRVYLGYIDKSYSDTFYKLKGWHRIFFWIWIIGITIPGIYYLRDISILATLGSLFVLGVLFSSYTVQLKKRSAFHVVSATGGMLLILSGFAVELSDWKEWNVFNFSVLALLLSSLVILPIGRKNGIKNHTYWIEFAFITIPTLTLIINEILI